jgi:hypothetical protein
MRLGQLSRKLGLKPSDIQSFLTEKGQVAEAGPNTRLTTDQVVLAVRHFDPSQEAAILKEDSTTDLVEESAPVETVPEVEQPSENIEIETVASAPDTPSETPPEVIRAPKQELPGLKVVGKIELKDPKKKEVPEPVAGEEEQSTTASAPAQRRERQPKPLRRETTQQRTWKNPLEVQREREAHERQEKEKQEREREKERRTQQYLKKVKSAPTKPVRRQEESVVETETTPAPKTWLGKIARWLTS